MSTTPRRALAVLFAALGLGAATLAQAAPVDAALAARAALSLLGGRALPPVLASVEALPSLAEDPASAPALWLATFQGGGFAFIRADDRLPPVAAWSAGDAAPLPVNHPAVADWLELQRRDFMHARQENFTHPDAAQAWQDVLAGRVQRDGEHVDPLLTCTWDQGWPWNQYCPVDGAGPGGHVWSGCVATAMAQVMYFWRWPDMGAGYHSYLHQAYGTQSADFGSTSYLWDAMLPTAGTSAAALLQYHCGVSVEMDYAPSGSGAWVGGDHTYNALEALKDNFRYPARARYITHQQLPGAAWGARLAQEIVAGRPVLDSGYGSGGHAFVLDGLDNGYFHLNWGWSGWFNGWYDIEALTPGGAEFSLWQGAIVDLMGDTAPQVSLPGQSIVQGQPFPPMELASLVVDLEDSLHTLELWATAEAPLQATVDLPSGRLLVSAPANWTGSATVEVCALDPQGLWSCGQAAFTVLAAAQAPRPVEDLRLTLLPGGVRLNWTLPTQDVSGQPVTLQEVRVHCAASPWFQPAAENRVAGLPAVATSWTDSQPAAGAPRYYLVVVN